MRGLLFRWLVNAGGLLLVSYLFDGIQVAGLGWALIAALFLGVVNALIRPVVLILTLPINILSLGLFTFVVNALMLWLVGNLLAGFRVDGFWPALGGSLVLGLISFAINSLVNDQGRWEVIELRRDRRGVWRER
jgi:putative membrane protein